MKHLKINPTISREMARKIQAAPKECFRNSIIVAWMLDSVEKGALYVEGYAAPHNLDLPIEHAWVIWNDEIIDVTWIDEGMEDNLYVATKTFTQKQIARFMKKSKDGNLYPPFVISCTPDKERGEMAKKHYIESFSAVVRELKRRG